MKSFKTNNAIVRRFEMEDVEEAFNNFSIYDDKNILNNSTFHKSKNETEIIIRSAINEYYTEEPIWAVENKENKKLLGYIRINNFSSKNKMCNITWAMSYKYWNIETMKEALSQVLDFLFTKKNIELVECSYYEQNNLNNTLLEEIGMVKEATLRDRRFNEITNQKENFVIYSINKEEFFEKNLVVNKQFKYLKRKI